MIFLQGHDVVCVKNPLAEVVVDVLIDDWRRCGNRRPPAKPMATDSTRRLHHTVPCWVKDGAAYHIRIRLARDYPNNLTAPTVAPSLLNSVARYHQDGTWFCHLMLLMPDHLHALLCFPSEAKMSAVIGRWKAWQRRSLNVIWQENYFDHRIRNGREFKLKADYIRQNPVGRGLCEEPVQWPWILDADTVSKWIA